MLFLALDGYTEENRTELLSRVSILMRDSDIDTAILSVSLSVRPSVHHVLIFYGNGLTYCHSFFTTW